MRKKDATVDEALARLGGAPVDEALDGSAGLPQYGDEVAGHAAAQGAAILYIVRTHIELFLRKLDADASREFHNMRWGDADGGLTAKGSRPRLAFSQIGTPSGGSDPGAIWSLKRLASDAKLTSQLKGRGWEVKFNMQANGSALIAVDVEIPA